MPPRFRLQCRPCSLKVWQWRGYSNVAEQAEISPPSRPSDTSLQQKPLFTTSQDGRRTVRTRITGERALPIPPGLDPLIKAARRKHKEPKPEQDAQNLTPFQTQLAQNPYAQALATPTRRCCFTDAVLPSHFLIPFSTVFKRSSNGGPADTDATDAATKLIPHLHPVPTEPLKRGHRHYVLSSHALLKRLGTKKGWQRLVQQDMLDKFGIADRGEWVWDQDMPEIVLRLLRVEVRRSLRWGFVHRNAGLIGHVSVISDVSAASDADPVETKTATENPKKERKKPACILQLKTTEASGQQDESPHRPDTNGITTPVFDLPFLLGDAILSEVVSGTAFEQAAAVVLLKGWKTNPAHVALTRLESYVRERGM